MLKHSLIFRCALFSVFLCSSAILWANVDRKEQEKQYLHDFVGQAFLYSYPNIYQAIKNAIGHLPQEVFDKVNTADFPAIFVEMPHFGGGRWANSNGIYVEPNDPPTFTKGVWIIKLSTEMEDSKDIDAIEGIVLHELAHFFLEHQAGAFDLEKEKEANHLVKKWGFKHQFLRAKALFGSHVQSKK